MDGWVVGCLEGWTYRLDGPMVLGVDCGDGLGVRSRDYTLPIELLSRDIGEDYTLKYIHFLFLCLNLFVGIKAILALVFTRYCLSCDACTAVTLLAIIHLVTSIMLFAFLKCGFPAECSMEINQPHGEMSLTYADEL